MAGSRPSICGSPRRRGGSNVRALRVRRGGGAFDALVLMTVMPRPDGRARRVRHGGARHYRAEAPRGRFRRRADELGAANRAKEEFLATLSHELRTPLNAMLGWTRLLRMGRLDAAGMERALETIERNAHMQEQLIADILDVSRIVTGKLRVELRPIELEPVLDAAVDALRPAADAKGVHLTSEIRPQGTVMGDPDRLQQVIWNLLANAIKFTPAAGRVHSRSIATARRRRSRVTDTGEGIAPELIAVRVRSIPAGRRIRHPPPRRPWSRPLDCPAHRRAARRPGARVERGPWKGRGLLGDAADPCCSRRVAIQGRGDASAQRPPGSRGRRRRRCA